MERARFSKEEIDNMRAEKAAQLQAIVKRIERLLQIMARVKDAGGPLLFPRLFRLYQAIISDRFRLEALAQQPIPIYKPGGPFFPGFEKAIVEGPPPYSFSMPVPPGMTKEEIADKLRPKISEVFLVDDENNIFKLTPGPKNYPPAPSTYTFKLDYKEIESPTDTNKTAKNDTP